VRAWLRLAELKPYHGPGPRDDGIGDVAAVVSIDRQRHRAPRSELLPVRREYIYSECCDIWGLAESRGDISDRSIS